MGNTKMEREINDARRRIEAVMLNYAGVRGAEGLVRELNNARARLDDALSELRKGSRKRVHLIAILDRSGSMQPLEKDTIGEFNSLVEKQRRDTSTDTSVTLVTFASRGDVTVLYEAVDISEVRPLTQEQYRASGSTALNDAMKGVLQKYADGRADADAYLVLVVTDGEENNSATPKEDVLGLIKTLESRGNFTFTYVGSHASTWSEAHGYGVRRSNTLSFTPDSAGLVGAYNSVSRGLSNLKSCVAMDVSLSVDDLYTVTDTSSPTTTTETVPTTAEGEE